MSISNMANTPIAMKIGDREIKVSRLSIKEIFGTAEAAIRAKRMAMASEMAASLSGKEKIEFLMECQRAMPKGEALNQESQEWLNSPDGIATLLTIGLNKHQSISEAEITSILLGKDASAVQSLVQYLIGIEPEAGEKKT